MQDGVKRMEVEFNPISEDVPDVEISAERFFAANIAYGMLAAKYLTEQGYRVRVLNPDRFELGNCTSSASLTLDQAEGRITAGHSREHQQGPLLGLTQLFANSISAPLPAGAEEADVYIAINHQSGDFKALQTYADRVIGDKPLVLWNPELAEARGKFGVPGFPPRSLHWEFLSFFRPVYFIQKRDFTVFRGLANGQPPIDVSGCLFREYPGPYQCMVRQVPGDPYRQVSTSPDKPTIQGVLQQLRRANGIPRERQQGLIAWWEKD